MPYIRYAPWCTCERSCNSAKGKLEAGLSVYEAQSAGIGCWAPKGAAWTKNSKNGQPRVNTQPWFLVTGDALPAVGGDGEPLLQNVHLVCELSWDGNRSLARRDDERLSTHIDKHRGHPECECDDAESILRGDTSLAPDEI